MSIGSNKLLRAELEFFNGNRSNEVKPPKTSRMNFPRKIIKKQKSISGSQSRKNLNDLSLTCKNSIVDLESLQVENLILKKKFEEIEAEHNGLKNRLMGMENELSVKHDESVKNFRISKEKTLVPGLKNSLKVLKEKLKEKEIEAEGLREKIKNKQSVKAENEIKMHIKDCIRLKSQLEQAMTQQHTLMSYSNIEEIYQKNIFELRELKKTKEDYTQALKIILGELAAAKNQEFSMENLYRCKRKQKNSKSKDIKKLKSDLSAVSMQIFAEELDFQKTETALSADLNAQTERLIENKAKFEALENELAEKIEAIQKIKILNNSIKTAIRRARTLDEIGLNTKQDKLKNPPKFFAAIHQELEKKHMIIEVFLSLLDKNNKSMLTIEEMFRFFGKESMSIKKKHIENALRLMGCNQKFIPLGKIEDWYNKFEYSDEFIYKSDEISDTENITSNKLNLSFSNKMNKSYIDPLYLPNLSVIFEEIAVKMEKLRLPKGKLVETLLMTSDKSSNFSSEDLKSCFISSKIDFTEFSYITDLVTFLSPQESSKVSYKEIKSKLMKNTRDWTVLDPDETLKIKLLIHKKIRDSLEKIVKTVKNHCKVEGKVLKWERFKEILEECGASLPDICWHIWSLKNYPGYLVDCKEWVKNIMNVRTAKKTIKIIKKNLVEVDIEKLCRYGIIQYLDFFKYIKGLNLGIHSKDIYELIHNLENGLHPGAFDSNYLKKIFQ